MAKKTFTVDARTILTLGRGSIKDHTTALVELVKNSYDADATKVDIGIMMFSGKPYIRVADNGAGMTEKVIDEQWLRIGFSEKITDTVSSRFRRRTGEKGIGRISADRLGSILELRTRAVGEHAFGLRVNWDDFDVKGKNLESVELEFLPDVSIDIPPKPGEVSSESGTELIIRCLRQQWNAKDIADLEKELSVLVSPFGKIGDFIMEIKTDIEGANSGPVRSQLNENYVMRLDVSYKDSDKPIEYTITAKGSDQDRMESVFENTIALDKLLQRSNIKDGLDFSFGPVTVILIFYVQNPEVLSRTGFSLSDLRTYLSNNSGIAIYRDEIRVKPYGAQKAPEWDWLGLGRRVAQNPAGAGRSSFRIGPNQLVGAVFVSRDHNSKLVDSSAREGLIQGPAFSGLSAFILGCVNLLENRYHEVFTENKPRQDPIGPSVEVRALGQELQTLKQELRTISQSVSPNVSRQIERSLDRVEIVTNRIQDTQKSLLELESQATIYRGLASIGIAASVFSHETQISISLLTSWVMHVTNSLSKEPPKIQNARDAAAQTLQHADRVAAWGTFTLDRIRRDKRRRKKVNIRDLIVDVIKHLLPVMEAVQITLNYENLESVETRTYAMDIESVILNLLTNAYSACKQKGTNRVIRVTLLHKMENNVAGYEIVVADSGPGVDKAFHNRIWSPLFTTKTIDSEDDAKQQAGTGLGLSIVDSVVTDLKGKRSVGTDTELHGARFAIWFPIER